VDSNRLRRSAKVLPRLRGLLNLEGVILSMDGGREGLGIFFSIILHYFGLGLFRVDDLRNGVDVLFELVSTRLR